MPTVDKKCPFSPSGKKCTELDCAFWCGRYQTCYMILMAEKTYGT